MKLNFTEKSHAIIVIIDVWFLPKKYFSYMYASHLIRKT